MTADPERVVLIGHEELAKAWDEGYSAGQRTDAGAWTQEPNPYRAHSP